MQPDKTIKPNKKIKYFRILKTKNNNIIIIPIRWLFFAATIINIPEIVRLRISKSFKGEKISRRSNITVPIDIRISWAPAGRGFLEKRSIASLFSIDKFQKYLKLTISSLRASRMLREILGLQIDIWLLQK